MSELRDQLLAEITTESGLSLKEQNFLDVLFEVAGGDVRRAMDLSGFPKDMPTSVVVKKLNKYIKEASKDFLIASSAKAAMSLVQVLNDPTAPGVKNIIPAAKEILDRGGVFKEEAPQISEVRNVFILPAKQTEGLEPIVIDHE